MNCDEAFDALTDPKLRDSKSLKWHLDMCPRCGQMKEILEPALKLFEQQAEPESLDHYEINSGTSELEYVSQSGERFYLSPESIQLAQKTAEELTKQQPNYRRSVWSITPVMKYIAVFLIGSAVTLGAISAHTKLNPAGGKMDLMPETQCHWKNQNESQPMPESSGRSVTMSCVACHLPGTHGS